MENGKERITKELSDKMDSILGFLFYLNRIMDKGLSICEVRWKLTNFEKLAHIRLAHATPILADRISGFKSKRNVETNYPDTTGGLKDYSSPIEFFNFVLDEFNRLEDEISDTIYFSASVDKDYATTQFLQEFLATWVNYVATMNNVVDLAVEYAPNNESLGLQLFDDEAEKCFIVSAI